MRAFPLFLLCSVLASCTSVEQKIDEAVSKVALPVDKAVMIGNTIATVFPLADLDHDGKVPSSLAELVELVKLIRSHITIP